MQHRITVISVKERIVLIFNAKCWYNIFSPFAVAASIEDYLVLSVIMVMGLSKYLLTHFHLTYLHKFWNNAPRVF